MRTNDRNCMCSIYSMSGISHCGILLMKPTYRSGFELGISRNLDKRGIPYEYETLVLSYKRKVRSAHCGKCESKEVYSNHHYTPDFILNSGTLIIEAKGKLDSACRSKMIEVKRANPDLDIRFLFMSDNKLNKNKPARYSDWCEKQGFLYAFLYVPEDWLRGTN